MLKCTAYDDDEIKRNKRYTYDYFTDYQSSLTHHVYIYGFVFDVCMFNIVHVLTVRREERERNISLHLNYFSSFSITNMN